MDYIYFIIFKVTPPSSLEKKVFAPEWKENNQKAIWTLEDCWKIKEKILHNIKMEWPTTIKMDKSFPESA